ncbi:hypothetical protein L484_006865 [Morus notabilis]|uniref:Uncharacterized protein n=1 Tax=Morus notabilis TaxID=981085 RepID=W9QXR3_9ROSA|nr:hypothetical protein L484_006865 [Morus notabilis]
MEVSSASKTSSSKYLSSSSSPCNFIQEAFRAFFRCLGFETNKTQEEPAEASEPLAIEKYLSTDKGCSEVGVEHRQWWSDLLGPFSSSTKSRQVIRCLRSSWSSANGGFA